MVSVKKWKPLFEEFTNVYKNSIQKLYSKPADTVLKLCVT
jgi:hypothetical protein